MNIFMIFMENRYNANLKESTSVYLLVSEDVKKGCEVPHEV